MFEFATHLLAFSAGWLSALGLTILLTYRRKRRILAEQIEKQINEGVDTHA